MSPDEELARFVATLRIDEQPAEAVAAARALLLDALASAVAGRATLEAREAERLARRLFGPGDAVVIGGAPMSPAGAAFQNGFQVTAATVCDVHRPTLTHVTPEVVPAVLAVARPEALPSPTGSDLLAGVLTGCEVTVRVAEALDGEAHRRRGWHNPGIAGAIGAAAGVGRTLRLDVTGIRHAMGHAASQAAGTFAALGTPGVKVHQARGALSGLLAGTLAAQGIPAALDALTATPGGLLPAYADGGTPERLVDGLGERWAARDIALRRWPAASSLQSVIAATLEARGTLAPWVAHDAPTPIDARADRSTGALLGAIAEARVDLPPRAFGLNASHGWRTQLEALQSARWIVAVTLADGECWVDQTAPRRLADPDVADFADQRVHVRLDDALPLAAARVTLVDRDGSAHESQVDVPPGDPGRPLTLDELTGKLRRATTGPADSTLDPEAILDALGSLPDAPSAHDLLAALAHTPTHLPEAA